MKFRPCIDLHEGKVKQIVGGSLSDQGAKENFVSDLGADYYASLYQKHQLKGGHIIALGKGNQSQIEGALRAYPFGMQVGGGVNAANAKSYIDMGATHVIITSYIFNDGQLHQDHLEAITAAVGKDHLVIDLSCRKRDGKYYVVTNRWQQFTDFEVCPENLAYLSRYCDEFLIHAVDVEGLKSGIDETLLEKLSQWVTIPCTYAGGITTVKDLEIIRDKGQGKIDFTVGSAMDLFGGQLAFEAILTFNN